MFDRTQGWMRGWELLDSTGSVPYEAAVLH
jgi:hypothetical protein